MKTAGGSVPKAPGSGVQRFFASPRAAGRVVTYSPSYTMIPSYECFNACTYCNFRSPVTKDGRDWMSDVAWLRRGGPPAPRSAEPPRRRGRRDSGHGRGGASQGAQPGGVGFTGREYLLACFGARDVRTALRNIGPLSRDEMARLRAVNASMGLMLEQAASLSVHRFAPSKQPSVRLEQLRQAGELRVPFTTGLLIGVGEDASQRLHSLELLAQLAEEFGHIQEVILQPHSLGSSQRLQPETQSQESGPADCCRKALFFLEESPKALFGPDALDALPDLVTEARKMLPEQVPIQVPPNLFLHGSFSKTGYFKGLGWDTLLECLERGVRYSEVAVDPPALPKPDSAEGARDLGGISPRDEVNPDYDFPELPILAAALEEEGYTLRPRLPVYPRHFEWLPPRVQAVLQPRLGPAQSPAAAAELGGVERRVQIDSQ
eukprot:s650_g6.t1